eukprot:6454769-Heterocapsa_arctica.AAC.1
MQHHRQGREEARHPVEKKRRDDLLPRNNKDRICELGGHNITAGDKKDLNFPEAQQTREIEASK